MSLTLSVPGWDLSLKGPVNFAAIDLPIAAGIFAVVVPTGDSLGRYRLLYVDETDNLADRIGRSHEAYPAWVAEAGRPDPLHVAWLAAPMLTARERQIVVRAVIDRFDPPCNRRDAKARWMAWPVATAGASRAAG